MHMGAKQRETAFTKMVVIGLASLVVLFYLLHSTPNMAVRTCVFFTGHPVAAITSNIDEDASYSESDKREYEKINTKAYILINPPLEKATDSVLENYQVEIYGFIYFAKFSGGLQ